MEWPKLKNIIIAILLLANLFLLVMVGAQERSSLRQQEQALTDALTILQDNGIRLARDTVPDEMALAALTTSRDVQQEAVLAAELLGTCTVSDLGGGRYSYDGPLGHAEFRNNGNFSVTFDPGVYASPQDTNLELHALTSLQHIGFVGTQVSQEETDLQNLLTLRQTYQGLPVFSCQVTLGYDEQGELRSISGQRLIGTPTPDNNQAAITIPTALLRILNGITGLGDVCSEINDITAGYQLSSSDTVRMIPVWQITTDTGAYILNTLTGELTRA